MELLITSTTTIRELKHQFSQYFPLLKLEFFADEHRQGQSSSLSLKLADEVAVGQVSDASPGTFGFDAHTTVAAFEQGLRNEFELSVQVYRRSGSIWLETIQTDNLTLEKQQQMAGDASRPMQFNIYTLFL